MFFFFENTGSNFQRSEKNKKGVKKKIIVIENAETYKILEELFILFQVIQQFHDFCKHTTNFPIISN